MLTTNNTNTNAGEGIGEAIELDLDARLSCLAPSPPDGAHFNPSAAAAPANITPATNSGPPAPAVDSAAAEAAAEAAAAAEARRKVSYIYF